MAALDVQLAEAQVRAIHSLWGNECALYAELHRGFGHTTGEAQVRRATGQSVW